MYSNMDHPRRIGTGHIREMDAKKRSNPRIPPGISRHEDSKRSGSQGFDQTAPLPMKAATLHTARTDWDRSIIDITATIHV